MKTTSLPRRTVLRGMVGGVSTAVALPLLDAMVNTNGTALAAGGPMPVRFGVWWWGSGMLPSRWIPKATGQGSQWALSDQLMPLAKVKDKISVVTGMFSSPDGTVHHAGQQAMLTGAGPMGYQSGTTAALPSIDVVVKKAWAGKAAFDALHLAAHRSPFGGEGTTPRDISHNGPGSVNPGETSPMIVFDKLFKGRTSTTSPADGDRLARAQQGVLDVINADAKTLRNRLGARDRARLDQHLSEIGEIEKRLKAAPAMGSSGMCATPTRPTDVKSVNPELRLRNRLMTDVFTLALACDLTRAFSYQLFTWYAPIFKELGHTEDFHIMTHGDGGGAGQPRIHEGVVFVMQELAYMLEKWKGVNEAGGTLLDNVAMLCMSEVSEGRSHSREEMPIIVAGGAGGKLKTDQHIRGNRGNPSTVHLSVLNAIGLPMKQFGQGSSMATSTIGALLA
ncbi:MAG: DUF1552 domain-containing protein [Deltaproteobacteria bacterium]|nr:DUF1552 domain-containing protein [Deltaproteobacteria bacterium]